MKTLISQKIIPLLIVLSLVFGSFSFAGFAVKTAKAQGPATPGEAVGAAIAKGIACLLAAKLEMLGSQVMSIGGELKLLRFLYAVPTNEVSAGAENAEAVSLAKKCIRDVVVKNILDWIVDETVEWIQGGGQPRYVTNWETFLSDAFNVGVGEIISETNLAWLCKPFGLQVRISLLPVPRFKSRIECTLDDIIANIEDFYNDFRSGGWIAYDAVWQPQNNFYGASLMALAEAKSEAEKKKEAAQQEAQAGKGFLSAKRCIRTGRTDPNDPKTEKCLEYEIVTPGDIVGAAVAKAVTSDIDWVQNVSSWTAALVNATINRLIKEGLGLMRKSTAPRPAGYGDYDPYAGYDPALSLKRQERDRIRSEYQKFLAYFEAILANKKSSLSSVEQSVVILNELKRRNCQPPVSDADITAAQNEVTRLTGEVASYQTIVNEINANITEANNISENFRDREMTLLTQKYSDFLVKYQSYITEISSGSETTKNSSQEESRTKQNELSNAQLRLNLCILTATSTTP